VLWRTTGGEGKLPHPWVTALLPQEDGLLVGTWGGGLVRRRETGRTAAPRGDGARWEPFVETERLEVSPGALAATRGRAWAGTDTDGLWRQSQDRTRFERSRAALPSSRVTALLAEPGVLWVGTDQGVVRLPIEAAE
jgi:ligand-binding sensor domain-containing protein